MSDTSRWAELLAAAATDRQAQPERICRLCMDLLDISGAGISMVTDTGNRGVVCATDDTAARIEELQLTLGVGPCIDAVQSGAPVLVADLDAPGHVDLNRWPEFTAGAREAGVAAVFAFPLRIGAIGVGALDLYRHQPGELTSPEVSGALLASDAAALAILYLETGSAGFLDDPDAGAAYQLEVHQATGMVKEQLGVSIEHALLILRARAFTNGRTLAETSRDVVQRRLRFSPEDA